MSELEQELLELREAIKELRSLRERFERIGFLSKLAKENPRVTKYFQIATLMDAAAVREAVQGLEAQIQVELSHKSNACAFGKLCVGKDAVADVHINLAFERPAIDAFRSVGIPVWMTEFSQKKNKV